ncbi:MAG: leucine--tRNA ligase [Clostridia bacterium]|nr:leucine--tRNA ligase [Clostridia bacterium]
MEKEYDFKKIEKKWQDIWEKEKRFEVKNHVEGKENAYVLIEFPYPSGKGLHVGHVRSYGALDAVARKKRLEGYNVLFPMGCDAFGLEAERTAIKEKKLPQEIVARNIATFKEQLKMVGLSFDWSREINTCDPSYYKWTQWLFLQFWKHGLAEKRQAMVNWCDNCGVLSNEEVEDGKCCQCGKETIQKPKSQWILKMTEYAERLADDLDQTKYMEHIKTSQKNWIGKSEGIQVAFKIKQGGTFEVYTTCIETIYGITFMVFAPEGQIVKELKDKIENWDEVEKYIKQSAKKSEFERQEMLKEKTGCILKGITAINPVNNKEVPIFIGDFVLANYGTGAVMAVPSHDQRDFEFAMEYKIPMMQVISGRDVDKCAFEKQDYLGTGAKLINSAEFTGLTVEKAKEEITEKLVKLGIAKRQKNFKMRDWIFSRQRYWGEPIPMIKCQHCGWVPVPEKDLPITLPIVDSYEPTKDGESPLSLITDWVNVNCPSCGKPARRETDTMPGWAGSSWYFMRYCDPHNDKEFASKEALKAWLPVNVYNGGNEHTTRHLLFARFWNKFFYDIGISPVNEPFETRISQGMILGANNQKMSKSLGNVVDPREVIAEYGADSLRLWEAFIGDYFDTVAWNDNGVKACFKLVNRVWGMQDMLVDGDGISKDLAYEVNFAIKKITNDIDNIKFNTSVAALMTLTNEIYKVGKLSHGDYKSLLLIMSPFAPHVTEEIWEKQGYKPALKDQVWPKVDEKALIKNKINLPVQFSGKMRGLIEISTDATQEEIIELIKKDENISKYLTGPIKKIIYISNKIINIII